MWNKDNIQRLLAENDRAVARAVTAIYARQTEDEKRSEATLKENGVGFNQADARRGAYYAGYISTAGRLTGRHLEIARKMMMKYWRQLAEIANEKQAVQEVRVAVANSAAAYRAAKDGEDIGNYLEEKMVFEEVQAHRRMQLQEGAFS